MGIRESQVRMAGSSPRVRGKGAKRSDRLVGGGIIPAGAGKRLCRRTGVNCDRDHPRGCGEKPYNTYIIPQVRGSSPRVRGKVSMDWHKVLRIGIIPAGAGKSGGVPCVGCFPRDHPRGCGEKSYSRNPIGPYLGSSPRVRGKAYWTREQTRAARIIPAGAGKSAGRWRPDVDRRDHPRGCGEKPTRPTATRPAPGSSPRVRGKDLRKSRERRGGALGRGLIH